MGERVVAVSGWDVLRVVAGGREGLAALEGRALRLDAGGRGAVVVTGVQDALTVLDGTPEVFAPSRSRLQWHGGLLPTAGERELLESGNQVHSFAPRLLRDVREEAGGLLAGVAGGDGVLRWGAYARAWGRIVRRVDHDVSGARGDGGAPGHSGPRQDSEPRPHDDPEEGPRHGSASRAGTGPHRAGGTRRDAPARRDSGYRVAAVAAYRALGLLATHAPQDTQVRNELAVTDLTEPRLLPYTRACVLESVRLWPASPFLVRRAVTEVRWNGEDLPAGTVFLVYVPLLLRAGALPFSDRFTPEIWLDGTAQDTAGILPFGTGAGACPGEDLALFLTSTLLAALLERHRYLPERPGRLRPDRPLPRTAPGRRTLRFTVLPH
ncbi:cytochrome P450 [Streptomyces sp. MUM 203J]|uniref:cytochrome P450 n=1 Tax=Streptomyces sp. MUM 203J TaxID=2791990 RepID=UPI001F03B9EF|nr:cytochrome P450 [Streptomyces sp. MUM 203J]MCH0543411.1 cytochrome P450 [Streptomyces sp. MUM 203J]